ncbi:glycoside hydrolase 15 protein [Irineochytrium annulatum]|nr:glycoside hydrolase 15 protein [Irineochytrium annulatum]
MHTKFLASVASAVLAASTAVASTQVQVGYHSFDGATLVGMITVQDLAFQKTVTVHYSDRNGVFNGVCPAVWVAHIGSDDNRFESWKFVCNIGSAGISQFYVQYDVAGQSYYDNGCGSGCNYAVTVTPPPSIGNGGFADDITQWLSAAVPAAVTNLRANIHPANTIPGIVVAAPANNANNYFFHWIRDSSLVMTSLLSVFRQTADQSIVGLFADYQTLTRHLQTIKLLTGLGEPKVQVDGSDFTPDWCRPQNDGPALRASSFIRFVNTLFPHDVSQILSIYNATNTGVIVTDLNYIADRNVYTNNTNCDLWEERRDVYLYTLMSQRKALREGAALATSLGDSANAQKWAAAASDIDTLLPQFYNPSTQLIRRGASDPALDTAIALNAIHNDIDGVYGPADDRVLGTLYTFAASFWPEYGVNHNRPLVDSAGLPVSLAIGRYNGDHYNGTGSSNGASTGHAWFLADLAFAEVYYKAASAYLNQNSITVTAVNLPFMTGNRPAGLGLKNLKVGTYSGTTPEFKAIVAQLKELGDTYVRSVKFHAGGFNLNEQYNRDSGMAEGVRDLTWSYAALITANAARESLVQMSSRRR